MKTTLKNLIKWLGTFPQSFSENSTKLLALLISALTGGFLVAIVVPFILIFDVLKNGYIMTNLADLGIFLCCVGAYIFGSGVNVKVPDFGEEKRRRDSKPPRRKAVMEGDEPVGEMGDEEEELGN